MEGVLVQTQIYYSNESQVQASSPPYYYYQPPPLAPPPPPTSTVSNNGFPIMAIAVLGIMATIFLLLSYYIFITKCCFFNWQTLDPLTRFSFRRRHRLNDDPLMTIYSPNSRRGLDELLIREIPTFQYSSSRNAAAGDQQSSLFKCVVCLNEFQDQELLRLLPKCSHAFHLDCIDIWLQNNANCPLCRTSILGNTPRDPFHVITAPNSSPREEEEQQPHPHPFIRTTMNMNMNMMGSDQDFVVIEVSSGDDGNQRLLQGQQDRSDSQRVQCRTHYSSTKSEQKLGKLKTRKFHHVSIMGDECINLRQQDDRFSIQPIRRSFSMDSAADRQVFQSVQGIIRHNNNNNNRRPLSESRNKEEEEEEEEEEESSSRSHRSIFSFGHSRGSRRSVLQL